MASEANLVPLSSVLEEVNRHEQAEETPEEEAAREERGQQLYQDAIEMIIGKANNKGLYRVHVGDCGEIHLISKLRGATPPQPSTYTIISKGNGKLPSFGTFESLTAQQAHIHNLIVKDFGKMLGTMEQERRLGVIPGVQSVQDLKDRFGTLPLDDVTLQERGEQAAREKKNQEEIEAKRELDAVMQEVESMSFEDLLEEEKKREKKEGKRKKDKKKKKKKK